MARRDPIGTVDLADLTGNDRQRDGVAAALLAALRTHGACLLRNHGIEASVTGALNTATRFFELPLAARSRLDIRRSPHFRGWSVMHNERDHREQLHIGPEGIAAPGRGAPQLLGPNPWPVELPELRPHLLALHASGNHLGRDLLGLLGRALALPRSALALDHRDPDYTLLKAICYHPCVPGQERRGVAAHCDWSWLTLVAQNDVDGLEVRTPDGIWLPVHVPAGQLFLNLGELLQIVTGGRLVATPHRVMNRAPKPRLSLPLFVNPPLDAVIARAHGHPFVAGHDQDHVHRVQRHDLEPQPFAFGEREWRRKGLGRWCWAEACVQAMAPTDRLPVPLSPPVE